MVPPSTVLRSGKPIPVFSNPSLLSYKKDVSSDSTCFIDNGRS